MSLALNNRALFVFLEDLPLVKQGLLLQERICSQEQILSFRRSPYEKADYSSGKDLSPLIVFDPT